jgi:para-aminobenzoate synthetase component 1
VLNTDGRELSYPADSIFEILNKTLTDKNLFAVGTISYEATLPFIGVQPSGKPIANNPDIRFLIYKSVLCYDHNSNIFSITDRKYDSYDDLFCSDSSFSKIEQVESAQIKAFMPKAEYLERVNRIKWHIHEGDIYQANFTTRFDVQSQQDPFNIYRKLRTLNPAPYSAYMNFGCYQILSSSPERMFLKSDEHITSSPIKGTINKGKDALETDKNLNRLLHSEKDKAELLMIIDLVRNDLGRIARTGTVTVDNLFVPEVYSSLIHLVSNISARLKSKTTLQDILATLLPGGSITGAPKKRAVEIIKDLEPVPRSVYTGCIGYIHGDIADFNLAIRTMMHYEGHYHIHAGGGIVADSDPEMEYREMLLKADNLFRALGISREQLPC